MRLTASSFDPKLSSLPRILLTSRRFPTCFLLNLPRRPSPPIFCFSLKSTRNGGIRHSRFRVRAMDEVVISAHDDEWGSDGSVFDQMPSSSSEGEESDGEFTLNPIVDVDLPSAKDKSVAANDPSTLTARRVAMLGGERRKKRIEYGIVNNAGLVAFLVMILLFVDGCAWKIVRLPLAPLYLMRPFCISAILASSAGYICVPLFRSLKIHDITTKVKLSRKGSKKITATMGGLFFVPMGIFVAEMLVGFSSAEVSAAAAATMALGTVGLADDVLTIIKNRSHGLSVWLRILLEVAVGTFFSVWLDTTKITTPYSMKMLVPLPPPMGLVFLGNLYLFLTSFCFVSMANGINLTDKLDGLAGGTAALAFVGMSIAVLPVCPDVAVFGASMAGACVGFLLHNRHKASIFMGNTGSLALGGALASMAACSGMFLPLLISSGIFVVEAISVTVFKGANYLERGPFLHHRRHEPIIVAGAYIISGMLSLLAGYVALISA
ncbi:phospho-N-acetylmuramoyl-pentapeptide-transferase homolog [Impatiens glandulifera]|uniref:phospho-N-acetylmuramoyl-pentapeptide- transferase homolog n=1 Tax=Impatiens glandulifera TaxID=253017 RepID=UPI001FB0BAA6|nr:phospho-N-acetylmuramoyl-pentapeptide-transferase homolog [Impatiens glandulifera]